MKKVILKISILLAIFCMLSTIIVNYSMAQSLQDIEKSAKGFIDKGKEAGASTITRTENKMADIVMPIAQILVTVGTIVVVVVTTIMGIKYMVANPEEKAKLKMQLIGLVVATFVIFAAQFIWATIYKFFIDF